MEVKQELQQYIDGLFVDVPKSRASYELQEELLANAVARYEDEIAKGAASEQAIGNVKRSIGNVDELIAALPETAREYTEQTEERRARSAVVKTIAIGLYIFAGVVLLIGLFLGSAVRDNLFLIGLIVAAVICVVPTCMLVYNAARWPKYDKQEETMVEDFKEWNNDSKKTKALRGAISTLLWTLTVAVYLLISFWTWSWAYTWLIVPVAACIEAVISLVFRLKEIR